MFAPLFSYIFGQKLFNLLGCDAASAGVVAKLFVAYFSNGEVSCRGVGEHQSADGRVGVHRPVGGERDSYLRKIDQLVYYKDY